MLNVPVIIAIIGGIILLVGLTGGGFEIRDAKMPDMPLTIRIISIVTGLAFLGIAIGLTTSGLTLKSLVSSQAVVDPVVTAKGPPVPRPAPAPASEDSVVLTIASSSTKQKWMEKLAVDFQKAGKSTSGGKRIRVVVNPVSSGGSTKAILKGKLRPVVWSPGARSWVEQLNEDWQRRSRRPLMGQNCQSSIYTPLGFAMWRPMAQALGWPEKPIGWKTMVSLASDPEGWARFGHPEWETFRLGHAHPKYGNSGLLTVTSFVYGMTGKTNSLTASDVYDPQVENALRVLAQNTAKYGVVTEDLLKQMIKQGPHYLHAIATYESDAIRLNLDYADELRFPVVFIFPSEGAFWGDHPYCIMDNAGWVTDEQVEAARLFLDYLLAEKQQKLAVDYLLRPLDSSIALHSPLDLAHGTDPRVTPETVQPLALPNASVSSAIIDLFMMTKRKATILVVLDISGSMKGKKMRAATGATAEFLRRLQEDDVVAVLTFGDKVNVLSQPVRVGQAAEEVPDRVSSLVAGGNTALHEAVCQANRMIGKLQQQDQQANDNRLYGIVILSDGENTVSRPTENQMFTTCLPSHAEVDGVRVFPIAFGSKANEPLLNRIADVTGGRLFSADTESINRIYLRISAEQ